MILGTVKGPRCPGLDWPVREAGTQDLSLLVLSTAAGVLYSHLYVPEALGEDTPVTGIARWLNAGYHCTKSRSPRHTDGWPGLSKAPPDTRNTEQHACPRERLSQHCHAAWTG